MLDKFRLNKRFDDMECGFNFRYINEPILIKFLKRKNNIIIRYFLRNLVKVQNLNLIVNVSMNFQ